MKLIFILVLKLKNFNVVFNSLVYLCIIFLVYTVCSLLKVALISTKIVKTHYYEIKQCKIIFNVFHSSTFKLIKSIENYLLVKYIL